MNNDRIKEIRARLDAWHGMEPVEQSLTHSDEYVADIAWLLSEVERLNQIASYAAHEDGYMCADQQCDCECGLDFLLRGDSDG